MTLAEIDREISGRIRANERAQKEKAIFIHKLADLIGFSVGRIHNSNNKMPSIEEAFPTLFMTEETEQEKENKQIERFKAQLQQFTNSHNAKLKGVK